jgi:hypothetical protein
MNENITSSSATQKTPSETITISIEREFALNHAATFTTILNVLLNREPTEKETNNEKNIQEGINYLSWMIEDILNGYLATE